MREKWWDSVPVQPFTANGTSGGIVTIANALDFKVQQNVIIQASGQLDLNVKVKRVLSDTELVVGPPGTGIDVFSNLSNYTLASNAVIFANAQTRPSIDQKEYLRSIFDEEPAVRLRSGAIDQLGNPINIGNPFPINVYPNAQIPLSLLMLAFPAILNNELSNLTYDQVISTSVNGEEVLGFYLSGTLIQTITLTKQGSGWSLSFGTPGIDFLLLENGSPFELENSTGGILLEH